jgi:hypothetical protein
MLSRALITATVTLLIGCCTAVPLRAENLEAGKSPSQIFAGTCSACHKGTRGLIKTVTPGSLPGFLRQHYTTSPDMAGLLSTYLLSNGATDTRMGGGLTKQGKDAKVEPKPAVVPEQADARPGRRHRPGAPPQEASRPDADGLTAQGGPRAEPRGEKGEPGARAGRRRFARPGPDATETEKPAGDGHPPAATANDAGSNTGLAGRPLSAKRKLSKRGRPGREELPDNAAKTDAAKTDAAKTDAAKTDAAKTEPAKDDPSKGDAAKTETPSDALPRDDGTKTGTSRPVDDGKAEAAKAEGTKTDGSKPDPTILLRADPVPAVTAAPKPSEVETKPVQTAAPAAVSSPAAAAASGNSSEPWTAATPAAKPTPPAAEASTPHPAPTAPAGPPTPPISQ